MPTLLEVSDELRAFEALLDEELDRTGGELTPQVEQTIDRWLAEVTGDLKKKADNYIALSRDRKLRGACLTEEGERMIRLGRACTNLGKRLEDRLKVYLELNAIKKLETDRFVIAVQGNGGEKPLDVVVPVDQLPGQYIRAITTFEPDTNKIRADLEAGQALPFAVLKDRGTHLRVR